jgi:tRNA nucleotidyltransferase (CCA-adding enzyme)
LRVALVAARAIDAGAIAQTVADQPTKIKEAVHRARVKAVAAALGEAA